MDQHSGRQGSIYRRVAASSVGAAALFLVLSCCLPFSFIAGIPGAQARARLGPRAGWIVTGLASLMVLVFTSAIFGLSKGTIFGLFFFGVVAGPAVVMTSWVVRGVRVDHAVLIGLIFCLIFLAAVFFLFQLETGESLGEYLLRMHYERNGPAIEAVEESMTPQQRQDLQLFQQLFDRMFDFFFAWIGVWFLTGLTMISMVMTKSVRWGAPERFPPIDQRRVVLPDLLVYAFIICGGLTLVPVDAFRSWCYNILIILVFIYFLGGLSILSSFLSRFGVPLVFRVLLYLLVMLHWPFSLLTAGVGLFDQWFDFRKLRPVGSGEPPDAPADSG